MAVYFYQTQLGRIGIEDENGSIVKVYLADDLSSLTAVINVKETRLIQQAAQQLDDFFAGKRKIFSLPLAPSGTVFQQKIWQLLCHIPYGETRSYKELAFAAGQPKAMRAVGQANNKNPIPIFIPCHRVIGANGTLVGYRGGLTMKEQLLAIEQQNGAALKDRGH